LKIFGDDNVKKHDENIKKQILILIISSVAMGVFLLFWFNLLWRWFGLTWRTTPTADQALLLTGFIFAITIAFFLTKRWSLKLFYLILSSVILYITFTIMAFVQIYFFWPDW